MESKRSKVSQVMHLLQVEGKRSKVSQVMPLLQVEGKRSKVSQVMHVLQAEGKRSKVSQVMHLLSQLQPPILQHQIQSSHSATGATTSNGPKMPRPQRRASMPIRTGRQAGSA